MFNYSFVGYIGRDARPSSSSRSGSRRPRRRSCKVGRLEMPVMSFELFRRIATDAITTPDLLRPAATRVRAHPDQRRPVSGRLCDTGRAVTDADPSPPAPRAIAGARPHGRRPGPASPAAGSSPAPTGRSAARAVDSRLVAPGQPVRGPAGRADRRPPHLVADAVGRGRRRARRHPAAAATRAALGDVTVVRVADALAALERRRGGLAPPLRPARRRRHRQHRQDVDQGGRRGRPGQPLADPAQTRATRTTRSACR